MNMPRHSSCIRSQRATNAGFSILVRVILPLLGCTGCTSFALEQNTLDQIQSSAEYRYKATLSCIATVAANSDSLPSFCVFSGGSTRVQDMEMLTSTTLWTRALASFASETAMMSASRNTQPSWTLVPTADYTQLAALRSACQWILYGPERANMEFPGILDSPLQNPLPGPHFGVAERLRRLPCGWLGFGQLKDVPVAACYKSHCGDKWVWVTSEGMKGLADFTLVLLDIATLDVNDGYANSPPVLATLFRSPWMFVLTKTYLDGLKKNDEATADALKSMGDVPFETKEAFEKKLLSLLPKTTTKKKIEKLVFAAEQPMQALSFREDRIVRPEHWTAMNLLVQQAAQPSSAAHVIDIPWSDWSTPYHASRTNVKAQGPAKTENRPPPDAPGSRRDLLPPAVQVNDEGISLGPILRSGTRSPISPFQSKEE
jgi:hypothetical protein